MARYFKAGMTTAALTLALLASTLLADEPATGPASKPAATASAPAEGDGKAWDIPGIARMGYFTVSDGRYAIVQDQPPPPDPNPAPLQPGQAPPPPPKGKWHLVDLSTGKVTNLLDALKECSGEFRAEDLTWVDFAPDGKSLLLTTGGVGARAPWWFDLSAKKALPLADKSGSQCIWIGDKVLQYEPRAANAVYAVPIAGRIMDLVKNKTASYTVSGTIFAVSDKGTHFIGQTMTRARRGVPARAVYALFSVGAKAMPIGQPLSGLTNPEPRFVISPGGKYVLAMAYDDKPGVVAALNVKTCVLALSGRKPIPLAQAVPPLFINDAGKAMTRTDKGLIQIWDAKGKEGQEIVKENAAAGVWNCNLYYITGNEQKMQLHMKPLPQMKMPDPKSKPARPTG